MSERNNVSRKRVRLRK